MLYFLGENLAEFAGPIRLLTSYVFLAGLGTAVAAILTWMLLPRFWHLLPTDQGREFAFDAERSIDKPVSAGLIFIPIFVLTSVVVVPFDLMFIQVLLCVLLAMFVGYLDDRSASGWSEYRLGAVDLALAIIASIVIFGTLMVDGIACRLFLFWIHSWGCSCEVGGISCNFSCGDSHSILIESKLQCSRRLRSKIV